MSTTANWDAARHWDAAYDQGAEGRSWYQARPEPSLHMLDAAGVAPRDSVIDIGGGASPLVDALLARGHDRVAVLDVSAAGLRVAQQRLGADAQRVRWLVTDLLEWRPDEVYDVWHDRAVFHFLTSAQARARYLDTLDAATGAGALAVFATFAPDGPDSCSGLAVQRYSAAALAALLGPRWPIVAEAQERHDTPGGSVQPFTWAAFRRSG